MQPNKLKQNLFLFVHVFYRRAAAHLCDRTWGRMPVKSKNISGEITIIYARKINNSAPYSTILDHTGTNLPTKRLKISCQYHKKYDLDLLICLVCGVTSQSTVMVTSRRSANNHAFPVHA